MKIIINISEDQIKNISNHFNIDVEEVQSGLDQFQKELNSEKGIVSILENLDYFNY